MKNQNKIEDWNKELMELCFEIRDRTYGNYYRVLVKFVRQLLKSERERLLERMKLEKFKPIDRKRNVYYEDKIKGWNLAVKKLETLKNQLKKNYETPKGKTKK